MGWDDGGRGGKYLERPGVTPLWMSVLNSRLDLPNQAFLEISATFVAVKVSLDRSGSS